MEELGCSKRSQVADRPGKACQGVMKQPNEQGSWQSTSARHV